MINSFRRSIMDLLGVSDDFATLGQPVIQIKGRNDECPFAELESKTDGRTIVRFGGLDRRPDAIIITK